MLTVVCPASVQKEFIAQAKKAFPKETISFLLGYMDGTVVVVDSLYTPDFRAADCNVSYIRVDPLWYIEAEEEALEAGCVVLGTIHSHPYNKEDYGENPPLTCEQSEADVDISLQYQHLISGICVVTQDKRGYKKARIRFWGPAVEVRTIVA